MQTTTTLPAFLRPLAVIRSRPHRVVLAAVAIGVIAAATAWQWSWLVAIGVAPLLLSVAPCAAMCGLGLCMHRMGGRSCSTPSQKQPVDATRENHPVPAES